MAKKTNEEEDEDFDDFDEEEEDKEEDEEEEKPKKVEARGRPVKKTVDDEEPEPLKHKTSQTRTDEKTGTTYSAYHLPERIGIKNDSDNTPIGEDVYSILAVILTKLEKIEEAVC